MVSLPFVGHEYVSLKMMEMIGYKNTIQPYFLNGKNIQVTVKLVLLMLKHEI